jgi:hypothetical protein
MNDVTEQWANYTQNYIKKFGKTMGVMDYIEHVIDSKFVPTVRFPTNYFDMQNRP